MTNYIELDAAEIRGMLTATEWRKAFLIARNVDHTGKGGRPRKAETGPNGPVSAKVSATEFAELVAVRGWSRKVVDRHLEAWEQAADDGLVPHAADLSPGQDIGELPEPELWVTYYPPGETHLLSASPETKAGYERAAQEAGTTPSMVARVAASPQGIHGAIMASPKAREAAVAALRTVREREGVDVVSETVREIKANPAAMRAAIMENPDVASAAFHAVQEAAEQSYAGRGPKPDPDDREFTTQWNAMLVARRVNTGLTELIRLTRDLALTGDEFHQGLTHQVNNLKIKADALYSMVHDGAAFDAALQELLDSETK